MTANAGEVIQAGSGSLPRPKEGLGVQAVGEDEKLKGYYRTLYEAMGPQGWWPGRTRFEVIVGSILTQNTAWKNVEKAIGALQRTRLLTPEAMERAPQGKLARLIRSSGYFRQKAKKLKAFLRFLRKEYSGSLTRMFKTPTAELREKLLGVHGIGPETADSILLYAGEHPVFVVDAYTHRILQRHGLTNGKTKYEDVRAMFETSLPQDVQMWNEFHALIVRVGHRWCRTREPKCGECPLEKFLPEGGFVSLKKKEKADSSNAKKWRSRNDRGGADA